MIVSDIMTTKLVTLTPDATLSHAANLMRQYQFHHLPVVRGSAAQGVWLAEQEAHRPPAVLEGMLTREDFDLAVAVERSEAGEKPQHSWEDTRVAEVMQRSVLCVTPTTSVAAAAKLMVERGINYLPVVEYSEAEESGEHTMGEVVTYLVGLLTHSDLLLALARALGTLEPGMELLIPLHNENLLPLASLLRLAAELHIAIQGLMVVPSKGDGPRVATVRLGTINPGPLFARLHEEGIAYEFGNFQSEGDNHAR